MLIDGKEKTFTNDFIKARVFRNALKMNEKMKEAGNEITLDTFDDMIGFVVSVFENQFTVDDMWDGMELGQLQSDLMRVFNSVLNIGGLETAPSTDDEGK